MSNGKIKFTAWRGGERPVAGRQVVEVQFRDGTFSSLVTADELDWTHYGAGADVVKYRAVQGGAA